MIAAPPSAPPAAPLLRAGRPAELRGLPRDGVRLLVVDRARRRIEHARFDQLGRHLAPGDALVVNTSRTLPAAIVAWRQNGTAVQLRPAVRLGREWHVLAVELLPPHRPVRLGRGEELRLAGGIGAVAIGMREDVPLWRLRLDADGLPALLAHGEPIRYSYVPDPVALEHHQTVYATRPGSAETPSAGRAFSWELLLRLRTWGITVADIVLHTALSSFQDDDFDAEHHVVEEWFEVGERTAAAARSARRVIAAGTTVVRALETAAVSGALRATSGWTDLVITARRQLLACDALLTGLHEEGGSHLDVVRAFVDGDLLDQAYSEARARGYLWHEFGDAMLIV